MCRGTQTHTMTVIAEVVLQSISCLYECKMSDGVFVQSMCQLFNLMAILMEVCQRFVCMVFVNIVPIAPTRIT